MRSAYRNVVEIANHLFGECVLVGERRSGSSVNAMDTGRRDEQMYTPSVNAMDTSLRDEQMYALL